MWPTNPLYEPEPETNQNRRSHGSHDNKRGKRYKINGRDHTGSDVFCAARGFPFCPYRCMVWSSRGPSRDPVLPAVLLLLPLLSGKIQLRTSTFLCQLHRVGVGQRDATSLSFEPHRDWCVPSPLLPLPSSGERALAAR